MLVAGDHVMVRLVKATHPDVTYDAVVVEDDGNHVIVRGAWAEPAPRDVGFATFEPGDVFTEHYWRDRWYAVKEVRAAGGDLKGWYTDIARPARVVDGAIISEDLELDLWVSADRTTILRLDEDEFEASGLRVTDPESAMHAIEAFERLTALAAGHWDAVLAD